MAITIQEKPYSFTKVGQKLIYRCTSSNVANNGFRFVFKIYETASNNLIATLRITPNTEATPQGILDLSSIIRNRIEPITTIGNNASSGIDSDANCVYQYKVEIIEGWIVAGVFTESAASTLTKYHFFFRGQYTFLDGYRPDPSLRYGLIDDESLLMGDRNTTTHIPKQDVWGLQSTDKRVFIPVYQSNYGNLYFLTDATDTLTDKNSGVGCVDTIVVRMTITKSDGTTQTADKVISSKGLVTIPAYPQSLVGTTDFLDVSTFPNYRYYTFKIRGLLSGSQFSVDYIFYPAEETCVYDNVQLAWYSEQTGGYDYFNFNKLNEQSIDVERTRIKRVLGNYTSASSGFNFAQTDRGMMEANVMVTTYLTITSDYIQEGEFELLKNLVKSRDVYIITSNGQRIPVLIEENNYVVQKKRNGKMYNITMKIRYSNEDL